MAAKSRDFADEYDEHEREIHMSDADLEALLAGHLDPTEASPGGGTSLEPGAVVSGRVVDFRGGEILVELDSKTIGAIDETEFEGELPRIGEMIQASLQRYDAAREVAVLTVREARQEIFWDEIHVGLIVEGEVIGVNKGGLTLAIKGLRAFLPISQIARERIEDASGYVGQRLICEVTSYDRDAKDIIVSRRNILEREAEENRSLTLSRLSEGEVLRGKIVKVLDGLGAFVDLGGVEGLLHESKIRAHLREFGEAKKPMAGQELEVVLTRVDADRGRITLDFHRAVGMSWAEAAESYRVGDEVTGWVTRVTAEGAFVSLDEGVEGLLPAATLARRGAAPSRGTVLRVGIADIDRERQKIELDLAESA